MVAPRASNRLFLFGVVLFHDGVPVAGQGGWIAVWMGFFPLIFQIRICFLEVQLLLYCLM
jgi:hypothetical protein